MLKITNATRTLLILLIAEQATAQGTTGQEGKLQPGFKCKTGEYDIKTVLTISKEELTKDCEIGFNVERLKALGLCEEKYPRDWVCKGGQFNRDLLTFVKSDVSDCDLKNALDLYGSEGFDMQELDDTCKGLTDEWETGKLSMMTLNPFNESKVGRFEAFAWCPMEESTGKTALTQWFNGTHYGAWQDIWEARGACYFTVEEIKSHGFGCDTKSNIGNLCSGLISEKEYNGNKHACEWLEALDNVAEGASWSEAATAVCQSYGRKGANTSATCTGSRKWTRKIIKIDTAGANAGFHVHHRNAQDIRYYSTTPGSISANTCPYNGTGMDWYRNFYEWDTNGEKTLETEVITCAGTSSEIANVHMIGTFKGTWKVQGTWRSNGESNTCAHTETAGYVRVTAGTSCFSSIFVNGAAKCTYVRSAVSYRNACDIDGLAGDSPCT